MSGSHPSPGPGGELRGRFGPMLTAARDVAVNPGGAVGVTRNRFWLTLVILGLCQVADLATFNLAVRAFGPSGELGPLGAVYEAGGIAAVAITKLAVVFAIMTVLRWYPWRRFTTQRRLALLVAVVGLIGAATNIFALV